MMKIILVLSLTPKSSQKALLKLLTTTTTFLSLQKNHHFLLTQKKLNSITFTNINKMMSQFDEKLQNMKSPKSDVKLNTISEVGKENKVVKKLKKIFHPALAQKTLAFMILQTIMPFQKTSRPTLWKVTFTLLVSLKSHMK